MGQSAASQDERLRCAGPGSRVNQVGEVSRLICLAILESGTSRCRPTGDSFSTGSACHDAVVGSNVPLGINKVPASGGAGPEGLTFPVRSGSRNALPSHLL
jgi:hypothetical protein